MTHANLMTHAGQPPPSLLPRTRATHNAWTALGLHLPHSWIYICLQKNKTNTPPELKLEALANLKTLHTHSHLNKYRSISVHLVSLPSSCGISYLQAKSVFLTIVEQNSHQAIAKLRLLCLYCRLSVCKSPVLSKNRNFFINKSDQIGR